MSEPVSRARKAAEAAFERLQPPLIIRSRAVTERDSEIAERDEKTRRLREARLARELVDKLAAQRSKA